MGRRRAFAPAVAFASALLAPADARPCTAFAMETSEGGFLVAKSYDWDRGEGLVVINQRGVAKRSLPLRQDARPLEWISEHASVTFNQYGREFPNGGMNDAGLVIEILWLSSSRYEPPDDRPELNELQWIQLQLDRSATIANMVALAGAVRVVPAYAKVHYFACDAERACAAFEYLSGKLVVTGGPALRARALANHSYAQSVRHLAAIGKKAPPKGPGSLARFARAATAASAVASGDADVFLALDRVATERSQWNIVYEPAKRRAWFRTRGERRIKRLDLSAFAPGCGSPVKVLDLASGLEGDVAGAFSDFTGRENEALLARTLAALEDVPEATKTAVARFPERLRCADAAAATCKSPPVTVHGWRGSPECRAGSESWSNVSAEDRSCRADADCTLLEASTCYHLAVAKLAAPQILSGARPCPAPNAGACPKRSIAAVCDRGCCTIERKLD